MHEQIKMMLINRLIQNKHTHTQVLICWHCKVIVFHSLFVVNLIFWIISLVRVFIWSEALSQRLWIWCEQITRLSLIHFYLQCNVCLVVVVLNCYNKSMNHCVTYRLPYDKSQFSLSTVANWLNQNDDRLA